MDDTGITRREFLQTTGAISAGLLLSGSAAAAAAGKEHRPRNVLLLMTDQHHPEALSFLGHPHVKTPNLDRLAREGVCFDNAIAAYPFCTPSRAAIVTGRWPHVKGPHVNVGLPDRDLTRGLPPKEIMTESILHERGFKTIQHGKWHLGGLKRHPCYNWKPGLYDYYREYDRMLKRYNVDHPVEVPAGQEELYGWPLYMTETCHRGHRAYQAERRKLGRKGQKTSLIGREALPLEVDKTVWMTDAFVKDLDAYGRSPFMMTWSACPPHAYWAVADPYYSQIDFDKIKLPPNMARPERFKGYNGCMLFDAMGAEGAREYLRCYYGLANLVDVQIGRILKKLKQMGQLEDTLIIFVSDHGDMNGAHQCIGKGIGTFYDEICRVPMLMWWPKGIRGNRRVKTHVGHVDIMPTILDYMGLPVPDQCQGESLRPVIEGKEDPSRAGYCERTYPDSVMVARMVRTQEWKLSFRVAGKPPARRIKLRWPLELYHLSEDPGEEKDLGSDPGFVKIRRDLADRLVAWMKQTNDPWAGRLPKLY